MDVIEINDFLEKQTEIVDKDKFSLTDVMNLLSEFKKEIELNQNKNHRFYLIGEMTTSLVHDLKNPLNGFSMMAESLGWIQQDLEESGVKSEESLNRLKNIESLMLKQVAEFDRRLTGVSALAKQSEILKIMNAKELEKTILQSLSLFTTQFQKYNTKMLIDIDWSKISNKKIKMNPGYLTQVVSAILKNSLESLDRNKIVDRWIKISIQESSELIIVFEDSAPTEFNQDQYFTKGYSTKENGMGLGLKVSRNILDMFSSNLSFDSDEKYTTAKIQIQYV